MVRVELASGKHMQFSALRAPQSLGDSRLHGLDPNPRNLCPSRHQHVTQAGKTIRLQARTTLAYSLFVFRFLDVTAQDEREASGDQQKCAVDRARRGTPGVLTYADDQLAELSPVAFRRFRSSWYNLLADIPALV